MTNRFNFRIWPTLRYTAHIILRASSKRRSGFRPCIMSRLSDCRRPKTCCCRRLDHSRYRIRSGSDPRRAPIIRDAASFIGALPFCGCQAWHLLFDGNVRLLGDADEGFPTTSCYLAYPIARADYRSTSYTCPLPGSHASSCPAR